MDESTCVSYFTGCLGWILMAVGGLSAKSSSRTSFAPVDNDILKGFSSYIGAYLGRLY